MENESKKTYISSDGTKKNIEEMDNSYLNNAYAKKIKEFFQTNNLEECEIIYSRIIKPLREEIDNRIEIHLKKLGE